MILMWLGIGMILGQLFSLGIILKKYWLCFLSIVIMILFTGTILN